MTSSNDFIRSVVKEINFDISGFDMHLIGKFEIDS